LVNHYAAHPITKDLDATALRFVSSVDSVKAAGIKKTPLMFSSTYARKVNAPMKINVNDLRKEIKPANFAYGPFALGYLLEGRFTSVFRNRFRPEGVDTLGNKNLGMDTKIIVVADGDLPRNEINRRTGQPVELGYDAVTKHTFANRDLILNMVSYMTNDSGLITARGKEIAVRPLDKEKIRSSRLTWQMINLLLPVLLLMVLGLAKAYFRKVKFSQFSHSEDGR